MPIFEIQFFRKIVNNAKIITFRKENTCDCKTNAFLYKSKRCYNSLFLWSFFTFNTILFFLCFSRARSLFDDNMIILDSIGDVSVCEQFLFGNIGSDTNSFFGTGRTWTWHSIIAWNTCDKAWRILLKYFLIQNGQKYLSNCSCSINHISIAK